MTARPLLSTILQAKILCLHKLGISLLTSCLLVSYVPAVQSETVQIPIGQQGQNKSIQRPKTGQSQESVKQQFGNPIDWTNPVGDPPITKWTYGEFVVYFEYDHVIHSVLKHTPQPDSGTNTEN